MKKISLFLLASLLSVGVIAQTTPTATPKPVSTSVAPASKSSVNKAPKAASASSNNNLKKTGANKKTTHHVTPVKKTTTPAQTGTQKEDIKK